MILDYIVKFFELDVASFFLSKKFFTICFFNGFSFCFYYFSIRSFSWHLFFKYCFYFLSIYLYFSFFDKNILFVLGPLALNLFFNEALGLVLIYLESIKKNDKILRLINLLKKQVFILFLIYQIFTFIFLDQEIFIDKMPDVAVFLLFFLFSFFFYKLRILLNETKKKSDVILKIINEVYSAFLFIILGFALFFYSFAYSFQYKFYVLILNVLSLIGFRFLESQIIEYYYINEKEYADVDALNLLYLLYFSLRCLLNIVFVFYMFVLWKVVDKSFFNSILLGKVVTVVILAFSSTFFIYLGNYLTKKWVQDKKISQNMELSSRYETLFGVLNIVFKIFIYVAFILTGWRIITGFEVPFLGQLGWMTVGIGLALKTLAEDFITGLLIMIEDTFSIGNIVVVAGITGKVEDITLRVLRIRDFEGGLHTIPFHKVELVCNKSKTFVYAFFSLIVDTSAKSETVIELMKEAGSEFKSKFASKVLEDIEIVGLSEMTSGGIVYEARIKMFPVNVRLIKPKYYEILKKKFDENNVELAYDTINLKSILKKG